jgi:D-glycero-D-manno-heptose 1,7-bisphosphate phosphatase
VKQPAVFLDRDGTLIEEVNYLSRVEDLRFFSFTEEAINRLKSAGFLVVVVTNQSGVGRAVFEESAVSVLHAEINDKLHGAIDAFYYCPHLPCDGCDCRKPRTGMIDAACRDHNIDRASSWMIGDKAIDVETGKNAGLRTSLVLTGYGRSHLQQFGSELSHGVPDIVSENLNEASLEIVDALNGLTTKVVF